MKFNFAIFLFCLLFISCQDAKPPQNEVVEENVDPAPNTLTEEEIAAGWLLLFDGKTTDMWRGYQNETFPNLGWRVEDGTITVEKSGTEEEGFGGDIITKETFENFELTLDFVCSDTANSGIFYRVLEMEGAAIWHNAPEYQILDNATYATMGITNKHFCAANYDLHPAEVDHTKPIGEWNTASISVNDNHVEHWLNGKLVAAYDLETPEWEEMVAQSKFAGYPNYGRNRNGAIGLQDHGHKVQFRNIKIRRL